MQSTPKQGLTSLKSGNYLLYLINVAQTHV